MAPAPPSRPRSATAVEALYPVHGNPSAPLEGLWTSDDEDGFALDHPERWRWTLLLEAPAGLAAGDALPPGMRIESFEEGRAAEVLHVGPYAEEAPTIAVLLTRRATRRDPGDPAEDADALRPALDRERARIEGEIKGRRQALRSLERLLHAGSVLPYAVTLARRSGVRLGGVEGEVTAEGIEAGVGALARAAVARALERGWSLRGGLVGVYPLDLSDSFRVAVGVPVEPSEPAVAELPELETASTIHVGAYAELPLAYASVFAWLHERGHEPATPVIERYLSDPGQVPAEQLVTRLEVAVGSPDRRA